MTSDILDSIDKNARIIFYPSSCQYSDEFQQVPYDVVILNAYLIGPPRRVGKVYYLNLDNNELLGLLAAKGLRISALVIIRDGCSEGGNYECIARDSFFGRLIPIMADQFDYFSDHGWRRRNVPAQFAEFETPPYLDPFINNSQPLGSVRAYHVTTFSTVESDFILGRIRMRIIRDSIWRGRSLSDLTVVRTKQNQRFAIQNYLKGRFGNYNLIGTFEFATGEPMTSIEHILQKADDLKLPRISLMPIANGAYANIADEVQQWKKDYPVEIDFYHLNAGDFRYFRSRQAG